MRKTHAAFLFLQGCEFAFRRSGKKIPTKSENPPDELGKFSRRFF